jgi:uncharacterized membrane protein
VYTIYIYIFMVYICIHTYIYTKHKDLARVCYFYLTETAATTTGPPLTTKGLARAGEPESAAAAAAAAADVGVWAAKEPDERG